jgi:Spa2 homology domain (SHD) of GIT
MQPFTGTDVYDELRRRQRASNPQAGQTPPYLLPKDTFHPKRNQARQKLSTLPDARFKDLATDVFYELERRFPNFTGDNINRNGSPAPSVSSMRPGSSRGGPPGQQGQRPGTRGSEGGFPRGSPNSMNGGRVSPSMNGGGPQNGDYGRPVPKTFQSNTIVPVKSTMVEDDDDETGLEDEDDEDSFGLEDAANRRSKRNTERSMGGQEVR